MDPSVGHLNGILARVGGKFEQKFSKKSNSRGVARGGMLKLRFDRYITAAVIFMFLLDLTGIL